MRCTGFFGEGMVRAPGWIAADTFGQLRELGVSFDGGRLGWRLAGG